MKLTPFIVTEGSSNGAAQSDLSVLQVFPLQISHWDRLPVKLIPQLLIMCDCPCDHQNVLKQEHVQLLHIQRDLIDTGTDSCFVK